MTIFEDGFRPDAEEGSVLYLVAFRCGHDFYMCQTVARRLDEGHLMHCPVCSPDSGVSADGIYRRERDGKPCLVCGVCLDSGVLTKPTRSLDHAVDLKAARQEPMPPQILEQQDVLLVVPTPGTSFAEDMAQRDEAAKTFEEILGLGAEVAIRLHANLDDEEIRRAVARYQGRNVAFVVAEYDSTPQERERFIQRWKAAGGKGL